MWFMPSKDKAVLCTALVVELLDACVLYCVMPVTMAVRLFTEPTQYSLGFGRQCIPNEHIVSRPHKCS